MPQLMAVIRDQKSTAREIEQLILLDSALAAGTLRMVNSAAFALDEPVSDLGQAVVLLGYNEIYRLASFTSFVRWEEFHRDALPWDPGAFARHSFCLAAAAEHLAEATGLDPMAAYSAGLVSDIGKLALTYICAAYYPLIEKRAADLPWEEAERVVLGYDSRDVGIALLQGWHFPPLFVTMLVYRPRPEEAPSDDRPFLAALHAGEWVAHALVPVGALGSSRFELKSGFLEAFGISPALLVETKAAAAERLERRIR